MRETMNFVWDGKNLLLKDNGGYEKRNESTLYLFKQALKLYLKQSDKPFNINISTGDRIFPGYYSFSNSSNTNLIPDYVFHKWESVHIFNYDDKCDSILEAGKIEATDDRLFWIGNTNTHYSRKALLNNNRGNNRVYFVDSGDWTTSDTTHINGALKTKGQYITLEDHTKYKYLLDIRGNGYSGRFKLLLFSGRPIFYVERSDNEYFYYNDLKPFEHYIPVKEDLSDLQEKIKWADNNEKETKKIAQNALEYALNNLRMNNAIEYFSKVLLGV